MSVKASIPSASNMTVIVSIGAVQCTQSISDWVTCYATRLNSLVVITTEYDVLRKIDLKEILKEFVIKELKKNQYMKLKNDFKLSIAINGTFIKFL